MDGLEQRKTEKRRHLTTPVWANCAIMGLFTVGGVIAMETVFVVNL